MTALTITVECSDGEPLNAERRDEIRAAFTGAGKKIGLDSVVVNVARTAVPASAGMLADRKPYSHTERFYEQAAWDKRHGRV